MIGAESCGFIQIRNSPVNPLGQAKEFFSGKDTPTSPLNSKGQGKSWGPNKVEDVVQMGRGSFGPRSNLGDGVSMGEKARFAVHDFKCNSVTLSAQAQNSGGSLIGGGDPSPMTTWVQKPAFRAHLKRYQKATGKTQAEVAEDLGTTYGTLRFWLSGTRPPNRENLKRAAVLFGCSVTEFMDDPNREEMGASMADQSERKRFFARLIVDSMSSVDLSDEDAEFLYTAHKQADAQLRALKERMKKIK